MALAIGSTAQAVTLRYSADGLAGQVDTAYETGPNGLVSVYPNLASVNGNYLVPLERAVGEVRIGSAGQRTRGLHVANQVTGLPSPDGTGVTQALTNVAPIASSNSQISSGVGLDFMLARVGTTVTYTVGDWSSGAINRPFLDQVNAFQVRVRSAAPPSTVSNGSSSMSLTNIRYSDSRVSNQSLSDIIAANGNAAIRLFDGIVGDFLLTGRYTISWDGRNQNNSLWRPSGSSMSSQVKLLEVPQSTVPEPATWSMLIIGFGAIGASLRRKSAQLASRSA